MSVSTSKYIKDNAKEYSRYVLEHRAIPLLSDGLKLSQRIALYLSKDQKGSIKTSGLAGSMLASHLYDHGDQSAADTIGRMAAPFLNNYPLMHGEGAFGTKVSPSGGIGAPRYTEVGLSKYTKMIYEDIAIVPMRDNYDGSRQMPLTFLPILPVVLLNGVKGVAVGFATNILPRKMEDVCQATIDIITTGKTDNLLLPYYEKYDGKVEQDKDDPKKYHIYGKVTIVNKSTVHVTDVPPAMEIESIVKKLIMLEDEGTINDFLDNSTDVIDIKISFPRKILADMTEQDVMKMLGLISHETENITTINPDGMKVALFNSPVDLIKAFIEFRMPYIKERYRHLKALAEKEIEYLNAFLLCFKSYDGDDTVIDIIKYIESKSEFREIIQDVASVYDVQISKDAIEKVITLPVYTFTKDHMTDRTVKKDKLIKDIAEYDKITGSATKQRNIFKNEIKSFFDD